MSDVKEITVDNYDEETYETDESTTEFVEPEFQTQSEDETETAKEEAVQPEIPKEDKSIAHFQRVAQEKHDLAVKIQAEKDAEIKMLKEQLMNNTVKPKVEEEVLQYPKEADPEDTLDQLRFARELAIYTQKSMSKENALLKSQMDEINAERQEIRKQNEIKEYRRSMLNSFVEAGADIDKAAKVYDFGFSNVSSDPKNLIAYYDFIHGHKSPAKTTNTITTGPLPVGVGATEEEVIDPNKQLYNEMERPQRKWL